MQNFTTLGGNTLKCCPAGLVSCSQTQAVARRELPLALLPGGATWQRRGVQN